MCRKLFTATALLALAVTSAALAQQTQVQDSQAETAPAPQTASVGWSGSGIPPEQAGDLYQARTRNSSDFGGGTAQDSTLPGSLNSGTELLGAGRQSDLKQ